MASTELVHYDPVFARFQTYGVPILQRPLYQALTPHSSEMHQVNWRFYDPARLDLDLLEGLEYWDQVRVRHPERVATAEFLDNYRLDHIGETGHEPRAQWYRTARRNLAHRRLMSRRHQAWSEAARSFADPDVYVTDHEAGTTTGTETFSSYRVTPVKAGLGEGPVVRFDEHGQVVEADGIVLDAETVSRYVDRSVSEAKVFNPGVDDGFTLVELLEDMSRFVKPVLPEPPEPDPLVIDPRYGKRDLARRHIDAARDLIDYEELRASAIEICKFKWSDQMADKSEKMARGRIWQSKLLDWGLDTWQVCVTRRRRQRKVGRRVREANRWTVFVRTHVGDHVVERAGRPDVRVWDWEPHYWRHFGSETEALDWASRLVDAFSREQHGDLDQARWPQDLVNDRVVASSQAAKHSAQWAKWNREGWEVTSLDPPLPGQIPFEPGQPNSWDPHLLAELIDGEAPVPEPAE